MSAWLSHAARIVAVIFVVANAVLWLVPEFANDAARAQSGLGAAMTIALTTQARLLALLASTLHLGFLVFALWTVARLFRAFSSGAIFVPETGTLLRRIGVYLLLFAALAPVFRTLIGVIVTLANAPGQRALSISFGSQELVIGLIAALLVMLGHIMAEAAHIADDHRQIV